MYDNDALYPSRAQARALYEARQRGEGEIFPLCNAGL